MTKIQLLTSIIVLSAQVWLCESMNGTLNFQNNLQISYKIDESEGTIAFEIRAPAITGWVAIGINYNKDESMFNSDYFMGYAAGMSGFGGDYHVAPNPSQRTPKKDPDGSQNWSYGGSELVIDGVSHTIMALKRYLMTGDTKYDLRITNSSLVLLWALNANSDDLSQQHTHRGSQVINFFTDVRGGTVGDGDGGDNSLISDGGGSGGGNEGGSNMISAGIGTILVGLIASILRN